MFKQQMLWTRVKEIDTNVNRRIGAFDVEEDLKSDKVLKQIRKGIVRELGEIIFDPDMFKDQQEQLTFANYQLSTEQMLDYARMASTIRRQIIEKASEFDEDRPEEYVEVIPDVADFLNQPSRAKLTADER